jgi:N-acetyltransferase
MEIAPVVLEGERVRLEPLCEAHVDALVAASVGHGLFRYYPFALESEEGMRGYLAAGLAGLAAGTALPFVTIERASGAPIGSTSFLAIDRMHRRLEIGATWLVPGAQRTAANTEAKYLQLRHCFESLGCIRVEFKTDERNARSRAALARIGAQQEGIFRAHMRMPDGFLRSSVWFSVIASDWPDVKRKL